MTENERLDALANVVDKLEAALRHQTNLMTGIGDRLIQLENTVEALQKYVASDSVAKNNQLAQLARHQEGVDAGALKVEALERRLLRWEQVLVLQPQEPCLTEADAEKERVRDRMFGKSDDAGTSD